MKKYTKNAVALPSGYQTMIAMNGGDALGQRVRTEIDEYLGLNNGGEISESRAVSKSDKERPGRAKTSQKDSEGGKSSLKNL